MRSVEAPQERTWRPGFDGLRGISVTAIVLTHVLFHLGNGVLGDAATPVVVTLAQFLSAFFCLSGFLLYGPFVRALLEDRPMPATGDFWRRRVLRIFPSNVVVLVLCGVVLPWALLTPTGGVGRLSPRLLLENLALVQGYFPTGVLTGLGASWSLLPELAFYALLPLFGWVAVRLAGAAASRRRRLLALSAPIPLMLVGGSLIRDWAWGQSILGSPTLHEWTPVLFYSFLAQMDLIALGMLCAVVAAALRDRPDTARRLFLAAIVIGALARVVLPTGIPGNTFVAVGFFGLVGLLDLRSPGRLGDLAQRVCAWKPVRLVGEWSYATYLWHLPILHQVQLHELGPQGGSVPAFAVRLAMVWGSALALGWLTTRLVGAPAISYADRLSGRLSGRRGGRRTRRPSH